MSWVQGDLVRVTLTWRDTRWSNLYRNIVNFRVFTGEIPDENAPALLDQFTDSWLGRMFSHLATTTYLQGIRMVNVNRVATPIEEVTYGVGEWNGEIVTSGNDVPQASACFVRRSYARGRRSLGRYFHGPLPSMFTSGGLIVPDPVGIGDLQDVCDALGDPVAAPGITMRPIVCGAVQPQVNASHDVRKTSVAVKTVYLRSRRIGVGE